MQKCILNLRNSYEKFYRIENKLTNVNQYRYEKNKVLKI